MASTGRTSTANFKDFENELDDYINRDDGNFYRQNPEHWLELINIKLIENEIVNNYDILQENIRDRYKGAIKEWKSYAKEYYSYFRDMMKDTKETMVVIYYENPTVLKANPFVQ